MEQYLAALDPGFSSDLEAMRANRDSELLIADMEASTRVRSQQLYAILSSILNDRCKSVLRSIGHSNGYEAWRVLENDMAPASRARHVAILNAIAMYNNFNMRLSLAQQVLKLEELFEEYRRVAGTPMNQDLQMSTLLRVVGGQLKQYLNISLTETSTYNDVRTMILRWDAAQTCWQQPTANSFGGQRQGQRWQRLQRKRKRRFTKGIWQEWER